MPTFRLDAEGWSHVIFWTVAVTLLTIGISLARLEVFALIEASRPSVAMYVGAVLLPVVIVPPIIIYLTNKTRELAIIRRQLEVLATTDGLTSCLNRGAFTALVARYLGRYEQDESACRGALLVIDADNFKKVNDNFGHEAGDEALILIAQALGSVLRDDDIAGRMGGEEFGVFLPGASMQSASVVAERVREAVAAVDFRPDGRSYPLSVSVGCAAFANPVAFNSLYRSADHLLYAAKDQGRNRVRISACTPDLAA